MKFTQYKDWHSNGRVFILTGPRHEYRVYLGFRNNGPVEFQKRKVIYFPTWQGSTTIWIYNPTRKYRNRKPSDEIFFDIQQPRG